MLQTFSIVREHWTGRHDESNGGRHPPAVYDSKLQGKILTSPMSHHPEDVMGDALRHRHSPSSSEPRL